MLNLTENNLINEGVQEVFEPMSIEEQNKYRKMQIDTEKYIAERGAIVAERSRKHSKETAERELFIKEQGIKSDIISNFIENFPIGSYKQEFIYNLNEYKITLENEIREKMIDVLSYFEADDKSREILKNFLKTYKLNDGSDFTTR